MPLNGKYNLVIYDMKTKNCTRAPIFFVPVKYIVLIQTDKSIYIPNDLVRLRVIVLDETKKPINDTLYISTVIEDAANEAVYSNLNVATLGAVFDTKLLLDESNNHNLGSWKIKVTVQNNDEVSSSYYMGTSVTLKYNLILILFLSETENRKSQNFFCK